MASAASADVSIGVDFGTSNTVVALARGDGHVEAIRFAHGGVDNNVFITALCFWQERAGSANRLRVEGGPWAVEAFVDGLVSGAITAAAG